MFKRFVHLYYLDLKQMQKMDDESCSLDSLLGFTVKVTQNRGGF